MRTMRQHHRQVGEDGRGPGGGHAGQARDRYFSAVLSSRTAVSLEKVEKMKNSG